MPSIWVCGLDDVPDLVERVRPGRLISLLPADEQPPTPLGMRTADHLRVLVDDIDQPQRGLSTPELSHVRRLVTFLRASPPRTSIVIHCLAGVSRSPAAALVALARETPGRERDAAETLRRAAPFASPNRRIVELADRALDRKGALVAALDSIGDADFTFDLGAFRLPRML